MDETVGALLLKVEKEKGETKALWKGEMLGRETARNARIELPRHRRSWKGEKILPKVKVGRVRCGLRDVLYSIK